MKNGVQISTLNAGQVLAVPYLPRLFATLRLNANGKFQDERAAERAVHLLQFMVDGSTEAPEHLLTLNKILCGVPLDRPIECDVCLSETEKETVEAMIDGMIQNWTAIGRTSVAGFRESFFQREGRLQVKDDSGRATCLRHAARPHSLGLCDDQILVDGSHRTRGLAMTAPLNAIQANAEALQRELKWFDRVLQARLSLYFGQPCEVTDVREISPPDLSGDASEYGRLVEACARGFDERLVLMLALVPHICPQALDTLFVRNKNLDRGYTEFGGWKGNSHGGFLPTCETAVFLLAGNDLERRFECVRLFDEEHVFSTGGILRFERTNGDEPVFSATLRLSAEYLHRLTTGVHRKPAFAFAFPAKHITTPLGWDDLVLAPEALEEVESIKTWITRSRTILHDWGLDKVIKPGYRSLFYGPRGTGKTLPPR